MRRPVVRLAWYRCWNNWVDITQAITVMGFLLSWISFPFPFPLSLSLSIPFPIPISVPLALSHPLVIDIPFTLMVQFHRRPPTLWWRPTSHWKAWACFTCWLRLGGREWRMVWARPSTITVAVAVTMMALAFQAITFTLVLEKRTWRNGHRCAGLSFPFSFPVPVPVPIPISVSFAFTVPVYRPRGKGRPRQRSRSSRG